MTDPAAPNNSANNPDAADATTIISHSTGLKGGFNSNSVLLNSLVELSTSHGIYKPLKDQEIRLLKFLPQLDGSSRSQHRCRLVNISLDQTPLYVALSYTWGSNVTERTIEVNNVSLPITKNLAEAIDGISEFIMDHDLYIWADSICIDQSNLEERGHQVELMSFIFKSAHRVAIWLGPHAHDSDLLFREMVQWHEEVNKSLIKGERQSVTIIKRNYHRYLTSLGPVAKAILQAVRMLLLRRWWSRAWIIQEATAASNEKTLVFCGDSMVTWLCISTNLLCWNTVDNSFRPPDFHSNLAATIERIRRLRKDGSPIGLLDILGEMLNYDCQDPRDKVYASLGMATDIQKGDIFPDYSQPCKAVYKNVVQWCINTEIDHSLDFFGYIESAKDSQTGKDDMPSWVPDWRLETSRVPLRKYLDNTRKQVEQPYNAGKYRKANIFIVGDSLNVTGFVVDRIKAVQTLASARKLVSVQAILGELRDKLKFAHNETLGNSYLTGEPLEEALSRILVADVGYEDVEMLAKLSRNFCVNWDLINTKDKDFVTPDDKWRKQRMVRDIRAAVNCRMLFITDRGYIGLCPSGCLVNDLVCVFNGGPVLYALRKRNDDENYTQTSDFAFIGECYVHGLMDGQAWELETVEERQFILV